MPRKYRKRTKKTPKTTAQKADKALRIARRVQHLDKPELKHISVSGSGITVPQSTSPSMYDIGTNIATGTGYTDRIGDRVRLVNLSFRFQLVSNILSTVDDIIRLVVFKMKEPKGVAQTLSDVLETNTIVTNIMSPYRWDNRTNFTILHDRTYKLINSQTTTTQKPQNQYKVNIPLHGSVMKFQGDSTTVNDNNLYFFIVGINGTNTPTWNYYYRMTYTDA